MTLTRFIILLILWNPLEAFCIVYALSKLNGDNISLSKFIDVSYKIGIINLAIQIPAYIVIEPMFLMAYNLLSLFIVMPLVLYLVYNFTINITSILKTLVSMTIYQSTLIFLIILLHFPLIVNNTALQDEFFRNLIIKVVQLLFIYAGGKLYEKKTSKFCEKQSV